MGHQLPQCYQPFSPKLAPVTTQWCMPFPTHGSELPCKKMFPGAVSTNQKATATVEITRAMQLKLPINREESEWNFPPANVLFIIERIYHQFYFKCSHESNLN